MKELKYVKNIQISLFFFLILFSTIIQAQNNALVLNGAVTVLNGGTAATPIYIVVNQNNQANQVNLKVTSNRLNDFYSKY